MLTKVYKIINIMSLLSLVIGFTAIPIEGIIWWKRNSKRKGLSTSEYFFNADTTDSTDEELEELIDEKEMKIWIHNIYGWYFFTLICDVNDLNAYLSMGNI